MSQLLVPAEAVGLRLHKIVGDDELVACEAVIFARRAPAVDTVLRCARVSGHVGVGGTIQNHFADVLDQTGSIMEKVALDSRSYGALKNHWMRCRIDRSR